MRTAGGRSRLKWGVLPAALGLALLSASAAGANRAIPDRSGLIVEGQQRSRVLVPAGIVVTGYENDGYELRRISNRPDGRTEIEIVVDVRANFPSRQPVSPTGHSTREANSARGEKVEGMANVDGGLELPAVQRLARALTSRDTDSNARARRLASWVARNIEYRLDRSLSQEPEDVLERRDAYCTGSARLLVELLRAAGLEAREVAGYALEGTSTSAPGFHRWVEYRSPGGHWRFVDPLSTFGYVPASFVRLAGERVPTEATTSSWQILEFADALIPIAHDPTVPPGIRAVPAERTRLTGARVRVLHPDATADEALRVFLRGPWIRERVVRGNEPAVFASVPAGRYEIVVESALGDGRPLVDDQPQAATALQPLRLEVTANDAAQRRLVEVSLGSPTTISRFASMTGSSRP